LDYAGVWREEGRVGGMGYAGEAFEKGGGRGVAVFVGDAEDAAILD